MLLFLYKNDLSSFSLSLCPPQLFHRCQRAVQGLHSKTRSCTDQECRLLKNVVCSLAQSLQDLSISFRHGQSDYLKRKPWTVCGLLQQGIFPPWLRILSGNNLLVLTGMKNREERSKHFFDTSVSLMDDGEDMTLYDRVGTKLSTGLFLCKSTKHLGFIYLLWRTWKQWLHASVKVERVSFVLRCKFLRRDKLLKTARYLLACQRIKSTTTTPFSFSLSLIPFLIFFSLFLITQQAAREMINHSCRRALELTWESYIILCLKADYLLFKKLVSRISATNHPHSC